MPDSIAQIGLILLLIVPGYICYSLKEMWVSYREKGQFEKFLNSLVYSIIIWVVFYSVYENTPRYYLMEGKIPDLLWMPALFMLVTIYVLALFMKTVEQGKYLFALGKTSKSGRNIPLLEDIVSTSRQMGFVEVQTTDGYLYQGIKKKKGDILFGSHPHSGDIALLCNTVIDNKGNKISFKDSVLRHKDYRLMTYIPKERIKLIKIDLDFKTT